ncbi:MAG: YgiQ family radical SAM protein [Sandaracinus sp.]|nr:YgiQ family radical SAM protein [Sandaracinus sp.]
MSLVALRKKGGRARPDASAAFLPTTRAEMKARGWDQLDVLLVNGDAYVDHPAFGAALIGRFLEARGYKVGIVSQPRWDTTEDILAMGAPRLFVGITAGNLDSMLNKLTAQKKVRSDDQYSPGGRTNMRPNRASIVYANLCRQAFDGVPIVLGGIEASLRRIAHYDYWSDSVRRSVLLDSKADLLIFGMGERPVWEIADRLAAGATLEDLRDVRGTGHVRRKGEWEELEASRFVRDGKPIFLPSYTEVKKDTLAFSEASGAFQKETNPGNGRPIVQQHGHEAIYLNPPAEPLDTELMDELYDMPFARAPHPSYREPIPAFETVKHSIVTMRGCFGGCSFCSITEHEGRVIQSRSAESVLREVRALRRMGDFRGVISDVGGPTANMYQMKCREERIEKACRRLSCVHPGVCENLVTDHQPLVKLLRKVRDEKGVRKVFIASGVRYDLAEGSPEFVEELAAHHTGGQLSVAPEHVDEKVLDKMKKPGAESYERFADMFACASEASGRDQHLVPYYISGHPGSTMESMIELALYLKKRGLRPRQVQDFIPTPMSMATSMYVTGRDPFTQEPVYTARSLREKRKQKALLQYWDPSQHDLAREALVEAGRRDLIGSGDRHLVPPARGKGSLSIHEKRRRMRGKENRQGRTGRRGAGAGSRSSNRGGGGPGRGKKN